MKIQTKSIAVTLCALLLSFTPAMVNARIIYFLVGVRHIYRIGPDRDLFLPQREEIEKTYADGVAADEATYQQHVSGGADPAAEAQARDGDLNLLADDRDKSLGAIFDLRDDIRASHPELQIQGDGPYQVMGIDYHMNGPVMVFDDFSVYAPWPGYVYAGSPYGGWAYGRVYQPGIFFNLYLGWHRNYISIGAPVFYGGFYGHGGPVPFRAGVFVGGASAYRSYVRPGGYAFATGVRMGAYNRSVPGGYRRTGPGGSNRPGPGTNRGFNRPGPGANRPGGFSRSTSGGYSHSNRGNAGSPTNRASGPGSFNRSTGANRSNGGSRSTGYSHSSSGGSASNSTRGQGAGGGNRPAGGGNRPAGGGNRPTGGSNRSAGGSNRSAGGGYSHGGSSSGGSRSGSKGGSSGGGRSHGGSSDHHKN